MDLVRGAISDIILIISDSDEKTECAGVPGWEADELLDVFLPMFKGTIIKSVFIIRNPIKQGAP